MDRRQLHNSPVIKIQVMLLNPLPFLSVQILKFFCYRLTNGIASTADLCDYAADCIDQFPLVHACCIRWIHWRNSSVVHSLPLVWQLT